MIQRILIKKYLLRLKEEIQQIIQRYAISSLQHKPTKEQLLRLQLLVNKKGSIMLPLFLLTDD